MYNVHDCVHHVFVYLHIYMMYMLLCSLPASDESPASSPSPTHPPLSATHTHCTQSYVLNNRLFPVSQSASGEGGACGDGECGKKCPACEGRTGNGRKSENKVVHYIR